MRLVLLRGFLQITLRQTATVGYGLAASASPDGGAALPVRIMNRQPAFHTVPGYPTHTQFGVFDRPAVQFLSSQYSSSVFTQDMYSMYEGDLRRKLFAPLA